MTYHQLVETGCDRPVYLVNPKYERLFGMPCFRSLTDLPIVPDLVVFAISGVVLERCFDEAVKIKVGGMVVYANSTLPEDTDPPLMARLKRSARTAGIPVCGGNSMGFYNYDDDIFISFDRPPVRPRGHIGLIAHSGSAMTYLGNNDARFCYNYVIASGHEINGSVADYFDYLLAQPSTRVVAIFLEAVRDVPGFVRALENARRKDIPVVITKLGKTAKSAALAVSHSGALVGDYEAFVAVCERYGAIVTRDLNEMITTALLFSMNCRVKEPRISSLLDSGGMREQMVDMATDCGLEYARITQQTRSKIAGCLEHGMAADNPLDAMGALTRDVGGTYLACGKALLDDPETGLLTYEFEFRDGFSHYPVLFDVVEQLAAYNAKPLVVINSCTFTDLSETAALLCHKGIPVINGIDVALRAIRHLCAYRSPSVDEVDLSPVIRCRGKVTEWGDRLIRSSSCDESTALGLMADFGLPVVTWYRVDQLSEALEAAARIGYPVVMKTAEPGFLHKSDCGGVRLAIRNDEELTTAYLELQHQLGSRILLMPMVGNGIEIGLGMKNDPQYGPLIVLAAGGVLVELLNDRAVRLAPVDAKKAGRMLAALKIATLLEGVRGQPAMDVESLKALVARFSDMVVLLSDWIREIDLNPVIVSQSGCHIVDALVVPRVG